MNKRTPGNEFCGIDSFFVGYASEMNFANDAGEVRSQNVEVTGEVGVVAEVGFGGNGASTHKETSPAIWGE